MNRISGSIPPCFANLTSMIERGTEVAEHAYSSTDRFTDKIAVSPSPSPSPFASGSEISSPRDPTASYTYVDKVLEGWKGQEYEYGRNFAYLKMVDLSANKNDRRNFHRDNQTCRTKGIELVKK